ncbi:hypothetical protein D9V70_00845 [Buchnera aphidicola (Lipaphis pseudobrassicae)]|uniref:Uncharacterized protein n=1 Tax=Buchnera aphidicola (Lipaphis pseudobrassicae) TaxID=1258543 RepID=A0A4D6Y880_9GAMM|nr:hypothetical protein D9V70_00845 [Buchnera aphidicola (Lipaphis pseudobrassicae)]
MFIEFSDILFSIDSIPAIFSITDDFFIILTSNVFTILVLRSMYFFSFYYCKKNVLIEYALSIILIFIGFKILFEKFFMISNFITFSLYY